MTMDLFHGFAEYLVPCGSVELHVRTCGSGPPLVMLHGYPQTHHCWHRIAPALAGDFTVVLPDLRGYGQSSAPTATPGHDAYAKRTMAEDIIALMRQLGHARFALVGHDRGARVGYRLALDHPGKLTALALLDILPTAEVWRRITAESARASYHWSFLSQPFPLPERLIAADPAYYAGHTLASWAKSRSTDVFHPAALSAYCRQMGEETRRHAMCEDYRAGATVDRALDEADRAAGRRIDTPTLVLWGSDYVGKGAADPLGIWQAWCNNASGQEIESGHFLAEENPAATLAALQDFLRPTLMV